MTTPIAPRSATPRTPQAAPTGTAAPGGSPAVPAAAPVLDATAASGLLESWLRLWNGDDTRVEALIAPRFQLHAAMMDGGDGGAVDSPQALAAWIAQTRLAVPDLNFSVQVGPLVDGDYLAVRWLAEGTYAGGIPGARAPVGTPVNFTGTDLLRVERGQIAEYWVNSDTLLLLTQLQVSA